MTEYLLPQPVAACLCMQILPTLCPHFLQNFPLSNLQIGIFAMRVSATMSHHIFRPCQICQSPLLLALGFLISGFPLLLLSRSSSWRRYFRRRRWRRPSFPLAPNVQIPLHVLNKILIVLALAGPIPPDSNSLRSSAPETGARPDARFTFNDSQPARALVARRLPDHCSSYEASWGNPRGLISPASPSDSSLPSSLRRGSEREAVAKKLSPSKVCSCMQNHCSTGSHVQPAP